MNIVDVSSLKHLIKVILSWIAILVVLLFVAFLSSWNLVLLSVIVGAIVGFLPAFILRTLADMRKWNIENIEKIYAPLKSEIDDLKIYFSETKKGDYSGDIFGYGKDRTALLSMEAWFQVREDNLYYRLRLDDKGLAGELVTFYMLLSTYIRNRSEFIETVLDPIFLSINKNLSDPSTRKKLRKIQIEVANIVLDARSPSKDIMLGYYQYTKLPSDYKKVAQEAKIPEKSLGDFVIKVLESIKGEHYNLLLEQRGYLLRDVVKIKDKLKKKLEKAQPI